MSTPGNGHKRLLPHTKHGLVTLKAAVKVLGGRVIDKRTTLGKTLKKWRGDLIVDLGGDVSTQQEAVVDLCVRSKLMLDSIDTWLLTQPSLINKRKKSLLPIVRERQILADGLAKYLSMLGLERRQKTLSLADILNQPDEPEADQQGNSDDEQK